MKTLEFKWTVSRGRDTYGYNICTLYVDGRKVARCNGGGYDMQGTCLGNFIASHYRDRLNALPESVFEGHRRNGQNVKELYGLTYHDPNFDPGKAIVEHAPVFGGEADSGKTVAELEAQNKSLGLERYQAFYKASSNVPTERHTEPLIDGACGMSSVERIANAIGLSLEYVPVRSKRLTVYQMRDTQQEAVAA